MRQPPAPPDPDPSGATPPVIENLGPMLLPTRSLGVVALVLFVLFAAVLAGALWPFQPLDPLWQLRLSAALINAALFPLLERRHRICSRLAVAAALGFLQIPSARGGSCPICCATAWPSVPWRSAVRPSPAVPASRSPCCRNGSSAARKRPASGWTTCSR